MRLHGRAQRAFCAALACLGIWSLAATTAALSAPMASASTSDPPESIPPNPDFFGDCNESAYDDSSRCVDATVGAIDNARAQESVGPMQLPSTWNGLTPQQQIFVVTNLERVARGLGALQYMDATLDSSTQQAAQANTDPQPPSGYVATRWGGNWAGAGGNPLEIDYYWMYDDGPNSNNIDCTQAGQSGCWIHRHNILLPLRCNPCVIGTGFVPNSFNGAPSWAELLADTATPGPDAFLWTTSSPETRPAVVPRSGPNAQTVIAPRPLSPTVAPSAPLSPVVGQVHTADGKGSWTVHADGSIDCSGDAMCYGSIPGRGQSVDDVVTLVATPDEHGYWMVERDGQVWAFGDAPMLGAPAGSTLDVHLATASTPWEWAYVMMGPGSVPFRPVDAAPGLAIRVPHLVGLEPTRDGRGYWVVADDGSAFAFGDAALAGAEGAPHALRLMVRSRPTG
ncbi:MAG: hypothetical protein ACYDD4_10005 [Acidimicrobiales bacterium]